MFRLQDDKDDVDEYIAKLINTFINLGNIYSNNFINIEYIYLYII